MKEITYSSKILGDVVISSKKNNVTIRTQRLELKSLNQIDKDQLIEDYISLLTNHENVALYHEGTAWSIEEVKHFINEEISKWERGEPLAVLAVFNLETQKFMGSLQVKHVPDEYAQIGMGHENAAELAYVLDQSFWGAGYGTEIAVVAKKYIKHICREFKNKIKNLPKEIVATVHPLNLGSKRILEKTLHHFEEELFTKFNGQPRILFFKRLKHEGVVA